MILTRLVIENLGVFKSRCEFDLRPVRRPAKPVLLIGGMNGTGKTTILDSIRLGLYGPNVFGLTPKEAQEFLAAKIHRHASLLTPLDCASVTLEFELSHLGVLSTYRVIRRWQHQGTSVQMQLRVYKDGKELEDVAPAQWEAFVRELIPPGVSKLYFFDAERIKELAEGGFETTVLRNSIRGLLGLDLVERLQSDLAILVSRQRKHVTNDGEFSELERLSRETRSLNVQIEEEAQTLAALEAKFTNLRSQLEHEEQQFQDLGGGYSRSRQEWQSRQRALKDRLLIIESQLQEDSAGLLPFALVPDLCNRVLTRLNQDMETRARIQARQWLEDAIDGLAQKSDQYSGWSKWGIDPPHRRELVAELAQFLKTQVRTESANSILHDVALQTEKSLRDWIAEAASVPSRVQSLANEHEMLTRELEQVEGLIRKAPSDDVVEPAFGRMLALQKEVGAAEAWTVDQRRRLEDLKRKKEELSRRIDTEQDKVAQLAGVRTRVGMAVRASKVLREFADDLCRRRAAQLETYLADCYARLAQKKDRVQKIGIDSETFSVSLYDHRGSVTPKEGMSAGEKQVYAFAFLWALARSAGREFPLVIDTPMARLDSTHRGRFVEEFLPSASTQTILLSTDTEVESNLFLQMEHCVARSYHLAFDRATGSTEVRPGYFWAKQEEVKV